MQNSDIPQGYREIGVVTPKKLLEAQATLEWLQGNAFRFEGDPAALIKAATAEVARMQDALDDAGASQAASVIAKVSAGARNIASNNES